LDYFWLDWCGFVHGDDRLSIFADGVSVTFGHECVGDIGWIARALAGEAGAVLGSQQYDLDGWFCYWCFFGRLYLFF
jgi:hypothetical protein